VWPYHFVCGVVLLFDVFFLFVSCFFLLCFEGVGFGLRKGKLMELRKSCGVPDRGCKT